LNYTVDILKIVAIVRGVQLCKYQRNSPEKGGSPCGLLTQISNCLGVLRAERASTPSGHRSKKLAKWTAMMGSGNRPAVSRVAGQSPNKLVLVKLL
jgi:hypothetical protein